MARLSYSLLVLFLCIACDATESWKLFTSRAGWSISYPSDWKISSCHACPDPAAPEAYAEFGPPESANRTFSGIHIDRWADKPANKSAIEFLAEMKATELKPRHPQELQERETTMSGFPALESSYYEDGWGVEKMWVVADSHSFRIAFSAQVRDHIEQLHTYKIYRRMLAPFRVRQ